MKYFFCLTYLTHSWDFFFLQILTLYIYIYITGDNWTSYICIERTRGSVGWVCVAHLSDQLEIRIAYDDHVC